MNWRILVFLVVGFTYLNINAQTVTIDLAKEKQMIDGFGASTAWHGKLTQAESDAAFKNEDSTQMGLSILRVRISPNSYDWSGWADEKANAQKAKAQGALILASPWSPPATMKTSNSTNGGELKPESYSAYAAHLKNFCTTLGNVDIVSLQNEPNIKVDYESCDWTPEQILEFCKNNASSVGTPIMIPEAYNFDRKYSDQVLDDSIANSHVAYIGGHIYGSGAYNYTKAIEKGKKIWMTEHYYNGDTIEECLKMAKEIAECMNSNMNAYVWWWLRQPGCNLMESGGALKKKGYTMQQFSKFVRPGYLRVDATFQPSANINAVAFKGSDKNVVVIVNRNKSKVSQSVVFRNGTVERFQKYETSGTKNMSDEGIIECSRNGFTDVLDAQSITTYISSNVSTGIMEQNEDEIRVFPNPFDNEVTIKLNGFSSNADIRISTLLGQTVLRTKKGSDETLKIGSALNCGMYIISISEGEKQVTYKIIKQ